MCRRPQAHTCEKLSWVVPGAQGGQRYEDYQKEHLEPLKEKMRTITPKRKARGVVPAGECRKVNGGC